MSQDIKLDLMRSERVGFGEAVLCAQKSSDQIGRILRQAGDAGVALLLTRLAPEKRADLGPDVSDLLDYDPVSATAFFNLSAPPPPRHAARFKVAVVAAGTSDAGPAYEAMRTLSFHGVAGEAIMDVGVAGLWRLMERLEEIRRHDVIIAVAGMDAALPSVLGGLVAKPLIAVPTSAGYGAARDGETALAACLASCAPGITVCNIDNGYGAACAALRIMALR